MQAEESPRAVTSERSGLKPTTAFLLLLSGAALVAVVFYLSKPDPAPTPTGDTTKTAPNFTLTNEQAITRFKELDRLRHQAFREVDESLLTSIYAPGSEVIAIAQEEIARLRGDRVADESTFTTKELEVTDNDDDTIRLRQVVEVTPKFVAADGTDITDAPQSIRRVVVWTLIEESGVWLIHDSVITKARVLHD